MPTYSPKDARAAILLGGSAAQAPLRGPESGPAGFRNSNSTAELVPGRPGLSGAWMGRLLVFFRPRSPRGPAAADPASDGESVERRAQNSSERSRTSPALRATAPRAA